MSRRTTTRSNSVLKERTDKMNTGRRRIYEQAVRASLQEAQGIGMAERALAQVQDMLLQAEKQFLNFENENGAILSDQAINADGITECQQLDAELRSVYMQTRQLLTKLIAELTPKPTAEPLAMPNNSNVRQQINVELQTADAMSNIPNSWGTFSGDYSQWHSFRDLYKCQIHDNDKVPITKKFQYLRASITGAAARAMGNWTVTEENYNRAWNRLVEVYEDDYLVVQTLVRRLLRIPKMDSPTYVGIRQIIDTIHECINQLATFVDVSSLDPITVFMAVDLLDPITYDAWESFREKSSLETQDEMEVEDGEGGARAPDASGGGSSSTPIISPPGVATKKRICIPSWQEMVCFLEKRARIMMHAQHREQTQDHQNRSRDSSVNRKNTQKKQNAQQSTNTGRIKPPTGYPPCLMCRHDHALYRCEEFMQLNLNGRRDFVRANKICPNCLKSDHDQNSCKQSGCLRCPNAPMHNSLLCPTREADRRVNAMTTNDVEMQEATGAVSRTVKRSQKPKSSTKKKGINRQI